MGKYLLALSFKIFLKGKMYKADRRALMLSGDKSKAGIEH
jgi:hypothetical protein